MSRLRADQLQRADVAFRDELIEIVRQAQRAQDANKLVELDWAARFKALNCARCHARRIGKLTLGKILSDALLLRPAAYLFEHRDFRHGLTDFHIATYGELGAVVKIISSYMAIWFMQAIGAELSQLIHTMCRHKRSNGINSSDTANCQSLTMRARGTS